MFLVSCTKVDFGPIVGGGDKILHLAHRQNFSIVKTLFCWIIDKWNVLIEARFKPTHLWFVFFTYSKKSCFIQSNFSQLRFANVLHFVYLKIVLNFFDPPQGEFKTKLAFLKFSNNFCNSLSEVSSSSCQLAVYILSLFAFFQKFPFSLLKNDS